MRSYWLFRIPTFTFTWGDVCVNAILICWLFVAVAGMAWVALKFVQMLLVQIWHDKDWFAVFCLSFFLLGGIWYLFVGLFRWAYRLMLEYEEPDKEPDEKR